MTSANANVTVNTIVDKAFENAMAGMQRSMQLTITSINGFNRSQRAANSSGGAIAKTLNQITKEGRGLSASFSRAKADMAALDAAFKKNRATIAQLEVSIKQLESANRRHGLSTKTGFDTGPLKAYKSQLESVNAMQKQLTNTQKAMNFAELGKQFNKSAQTLSYAGMRMTYGLSLPISMFLRTGFQSLKALDKEVIRTGKLIGDGFSQGAKGTAKFNEAMGILDQRLDKLSITWGVSRELVQGLAGDFAEIGISDPKALASLAQFTAEFEKLGNVDITQAQAAIQSIYQQIARVRRDQGIAVTGTKAINQMIEEVRGAIAFFNFAENKTTLSLKDMADAFPEVSAAATSFGLNMQTTAALLAPMVGAGFQVGASANSIKVSLQRLVAPTKKNQDIIASLTKVLGKDFRLSTKIGAEGIQDLIDGYTKLQGKLGDAGALTFFAELFGVRQGPRMEVAIKQMSEYQQELDKAGSAERTLAKELELQVNKQLQLVAIRNRSAEGRKVELVQLNNIKDIQDLIGQSQEKSAGGEFTERALAIQKAQEAEVKRLKENNSEIDKGNSLLGERFDRIKTESGKILSGAMFGTALTKETLEEELTRVQGSLQVRYGRARESIKSIARELTVVFGDLLAAINPILEKISSWIQLLPSGTKKLIGVVLILLAALGPVLRTFGAVAQIAGSFSTMRSKGIMKMKDDMVSLNGTLIESSNLLTRLGGKFTKIGKDGNFFGSKKDLKRLERAAPIQQKIDAGEKVSFAEKSIYQKSIKGLIGRKEYRRVQAANAMGQGGPLDQPTLPVGSANLSGLDARSIIAAQNLQDPAKAIERFTIDLIKRLNDAAIKAAQRASKQTTNLKPRVGANSAAGGVITPFGVVKTPTTAPATQTAASAATTSQQKPVSAQYYTKLMAILQAIQKCICSPGKVVTTSGGKPGGGQPASSNAPPAPQPTTPRPTTPQPVAPQPAGGGSNASSTVPVPTPRLKPIFPFPAFPTSAIQDRIENALKSVNIQPSTPKPTQVKVGQVFKPTMGYGAIPFAPVATQAVKSQENVVQQTSNDVKQAETVAKQTESKAKKAKTVIARVSDKVTITKNSLLQIMQEAGVAIPQQFQQMKDFQITVQKQTYERIKAVLSSATGAADFATGKIKSLSGTSRAGKYDQPIKEALGIERLRTSPKVIKKERDLTHLADIRSSKVNKQYEADREHYISVGKKHLATVDKFETEINTIANQIDIAKKKGDQKEVERLESEGRYKTKILAEVQQAIEKNILKIQALSRNAIRDSYIYFADAQQSRRAAGQQTFATRAQARGFAQKEGLRYTDVAYSGRKNLEDRKSMGLAPARQLTEEDKQRRQFGLSEAYQRRQEIRTGTRITAADIGMPKAPTAKEMAESVKGFTSKFEAGEGARIQAQASSAYDETLKIKKEILNLTNKLDKTKEKLGNIAIEIQDLESKAPKGKLRSPKAIAKDTARLERIEKLEKDFSKTRQAVEDAEKQLLDANTRLQAVQGIASGYAPKASSVGTGGFKQPRTVQASIPLEETGLIVKGPEKLTDTAKKALKAQIVEFEKQIKLIQEKIAGYQTFKGSNVAKEKIADLERSRAQLQSQIEQARAKLMADLPKISGGAFGFDTVLQQLQASLNLPAQKFEELVAELRRRAPGTVAGLDAPIAKVKGDVGKVVEAIKSAVSAGNGSLESLYAAVIGQRNQLNKFGKQVATAAQTSGDTIYGFGLPRGTDEGKEPGTQKGLAKQVADRIRATKTASDDFMKYEKKTLEYIAKEFGIVNASKMNKEPLVQELKKVLKALTNTIDTAINNEIKTVEQAAQAAKSTGSATQQKPTTKGYVPPYVAPAGAPMSDIIHNVAASTLPSFRPLGEQPLTTAELKQRIEEHQAAGPQPAKTVNAKDALAGLKQTTEKVITTATEAINQATAAIKEPLALGMGRRAVAQAKLAAAQLGTAGTEAISMASSQIPLALGMGKRAIAEAKLTAAMTGTAGTTPIALGMSRVDQLKALIPPRPTKERYAPKTPTAREIAGIPITGRGVARVGAAVSTGGISEIGILLKNIIAKKIGTDAQQVRYMDPRMQYEIAKRQTTRERGIGPASSARQQRKAEIDARQIARDPNNPLAALTRLSNVVGTIPSKFAMKFIPIRDNIQAIGNLYGPPILKAIDTAKTKTISISKSIIKTAYQIEKEIIKSPVTSTIIMAKGLIAAGAQIQAVMPKVVATAKKAFDALGGLNFIQTTKLGNALYLSAGGLATVGAGTAKFIHKAFTDPKVALEMASKGLGIAANKIKEQGKKLAIAAGNLALAPVKAAARAVSKPVFAVTQGLFGVGGQARTVEGPGGSTITKKGFFRRDVITNQDGTQSRGAGFIGKTMKGVGGAFKGAIGMGGQMASMLTYQLGPAGMLLQGPMNKVIGLMQRFSKVSGPVTIIITAIVIAIMVLKKTFENMGGKAQNIIDNLKAAFENIKAVFGMLVGVFKDFFASLFGNGAKDAEEGGENIRQVVGSISEKVLAFTEKFKAFFEKTLEPVIRKVLSGVSLAIKGIIGFIGPIIQFIKNLVGYFKGGGEESKKEMGKAFDGMKEAAGKVFTGLITIFKTPFIFLIDIVFKVLGLITNIFERMADGIIIVIQYLIKGIINGFFAIPRGVVAIVQEVVRIWTNLEKALVDIAKESVKFIIKALFTLTNGAVSLVGKLISIFGALIAGWGKILDKMSELFIQWMNNILDFAARQDGFFGAFLDYTGITALSKGFKFIVGIAGKGLSAIGSVYESVGNKINEITNSVTSGLSNGLAAAEGKALSFTDSVGNGIKAVLSSVRDIFELGDDVLKVAQDAALSGVDNVANNVRDAIGSSSDWVVGIGKGIKDWINGLTTAENIAKGIGKDVGGKEDKKTDAQTPSQAVASGITIAEAIDEGTKALKRGFFDKVIDSLSNAINKFKDKFREGLEKQKQDVLKFFDDQIAAIDALAEAEERLTATKEYEENRRLKIAERALQRDSYVKQRALAIYEGRIDDARLLSLQEEKDNRDFNKDLGKMDEDRNKTLQSQNREQAKKVIQQQKEQLSEKFDKDIKNFEQFVESIGKNGTLTKDQLTEQFKALQTEALKTSGDMKEAFQTYYTALPGLIQQNTDPTVGAFNMSLDTLIQAATTKYGTDVNSKDPASLLGITGLMLSGTSQAYTDGFNNSIIPAYSAGISEITKIGTDFNDPKNPNSPQNLYAKAISDANEAMIAEFYKMKTDATSAFAQVVDGLNAEAKRLAVEEAIRSATEQIDEEEKKRKRREGAEQALSGGTGDKSSPMGISRKMFLTEAGKDKVFKLGDTDEIIAAAKAKLIEYQMLPADTELSQKFDQPMKKALLAFQKKYLAKEMKNPQGNLGAGTAKALGLLGSAGVQKKYYGGSIKKSMAVGGIVPGFAQQGVPAILHGGEYVINSKAVSGLGQMFLNYINEFKFGIPRYTAPKIGMPQMGNQFKTEVIKTENETIHNYNFYVDNFIGEDQWFESMMKNYNVKVLPNRQKAAGLENRVVRTYNGINRGM